MRSRNFRPMSSPNPARGWFLRLARQRRSFHLALFGNAGKPSGRPVKPDPRAKS